MKVGDGHSFEKEDFGHRDLGKEVMNRTSDQDWWDLGRKMKKTNLS